MPLIKARAQFTHVTYLGGHPEHPKEKSNGLLVVDDEGLHMRGMREMFVIPWSEIAEFVVEGPEDKAARVTATRLVGHGRQSPPPVRG